MCVMNTTRVKITVCFMLRKNVTRTTQVKIIFFKATRMLQGQTQDMAQKWTGSNIFVKTLRISMKFIVVFDFIFVPNYQPSTENSWIFFLQPLEYFHQNPYLHVCLYLNCLIN